jgi:TonB-linked SusC/RagA family outer membrane protein
MYYQLKRRLLVLLLVIFGCLQSWAQSKTVTGVVRGENNELLNGVSVSIKGTNRTTTTNEKGEFSILAAPESVLRFSFVGYSFQEFMVGDKTSFSVTLSSVNKQMDDVVVVGYGTQKRGHITSSIETIKGSELEDLPLGNLGAALSGRILGLSVSGGTSRPGSQAQLTIRNPQSLAKDGGNNSPLYVIDDIIQVTSQGAPDATLFNSLDPSEVESISILKDASAAVYGSRGANGVILVRTKRGVLGKPRITYSGSYAINDEAYRTKMMSAYDLARYINIVNGPNGANATGNPEQNFFSQDELDHFRTINHDWLDQAWKSSYNTRHTLNISGGADRATYFANASYYTQDGNLGKLEFGKWTYRAGADMSVASGLKIGLQVSGNQQNSRRVNSEIGGENVENDYRNLLRAPRYVPTYINGLPVKLPATNTSNNLSAYHFFELNNLDNYIDADQALLSVNINAEYEVPFIKGLKARGSYGRNVTHSRDSRIGTRFTLYRFTLQGQNQHIYEGATDPVGNSYQNDNRVRFSNIRSELYQANFSLSYNRRFGQHDISAFFSAEKSESESSQEDAFKDDPSQFTNGQFNTAFGTIDGRTFAYESGNLGYIGRLSYNYSSKYLFDFLFRTDASTKFAPENYWGKFYTIGLGWVISQEDFFKFSGVNYLKLRYSVGLLGKDDLRAWQWRQRYTFQNGQGAVFGADNTPAGIGIKMEVSPNRDVMWSDDFKQNLGIDARFLKNRLSTTIELFYNKGTGMFIERTGNVPVTVGGSIASENWGKIDFYGIELGVGWNGTVGRNFTYGIDTRFSWSDNKVHQGNFNDFNLNFPWFARPGQSTDNGKWGYDYLGMFRSQQEINEYVSKNGITEVFGEPVANLKPGMLYYRDVRGALQADGKFAGPDGIIDNNDQIQLTKRASNMYGFGTTLRAGYKGINFECVIAGSFGGWSEIDARSLLQRNILNLYQSGPAYWGDIYDPQLNPSGKYPNPYWSDINTTPVSNFWKVSGFRMRVRNATLSYSLPKAVTNAMKISNARFVLTALNPLNLYNPFDYKDSDGSWDNYPVLRTFSIGVNVGL